MTISIITQSRDAYFAIQPLNRAPAPQPPYSSFIEHEVLGILKSIVGKFAIQLFKPHPPVMFSQLITLAQRMQRPSEATIAVALLCGRLIDYPQRLSVDGDIELGCKTLAALVLL